MLLIREEYIIKHFLWKSVVSKLAPIEVEIRPERSGRPYCNGKRE